MATSRSVELVGRVLGGRYRLSRPIGTGASAHVYAADDVLLRRRVAVKVLHPGLAGDEAFGRRFRAEARAAAGVRHPHILQVYDTGDDGGTPYVVMELLDGGSLRALLDRGHLLTLSQAVRLGTDVAGALDYAHRHGLVHRDIKPANLIFDDEGRVTVADFGLARALAEATWTEPIGGIVGTARYAAPEQVRGERLDGRADVYSLALVLIEAVTGSVPFATDSTVGTLFARLERPLRPGTEMGPLAEVLAGAGTVERSERLDAGQLATALGAIASGLPPPAPLPLTGATERVEIERDDSRTEIPGGRPIPFDIEAVEGGARPTGLPAFPTVGRSHPESPAGDHPDIGGLVSPPTDGHRGDPPIQPGAPDRFGPQIHSDSPDRQEVSHSKLAPSVRDSPGEDHIGQGDDGGEGRTRRRWRRWLLAGLAVLALAGGAIAALILTQPPPTHPVPALIGDDAVHAQALLGPLHLHMTVTSKTFDPKVPAGHILTQTPSGGRLGEGSAVGVTMSLGPQPIPVPTGLAGQSQADATSVLTTLGLTPGTVTQASSQTITEGDVISSSPASGTLLPGQPVALVVSSGKPIVAVPALSATTGASFAAAQSTLASAGLVATETDHFSDSVPKGQVVSTAPAPGAQVRSGTAVTVTVSKGPDVVTVPSVYSESVTAATQAMTGDGLIVTGVNGNPTATVTGSTPAAGSIVHRGAHVTLTTG